MIVLQQALLMAGTGAVAGGGVTYVGQSTGSPSAGSYTYANAPLASSATDVIVVAFFADSSSGGYSTTGVTVGGVALTKWSPGDVGAGYVGYGTFSFYYGVPGAFSTANIIATTTGSPSGTSLGVWKISGASAAPLATIVPAHGNSGSDTITISTAVGGAAIGFTTISFPATISETWSGADAVTEDFEVTDATGNHKLAGFHITTTQTSTTNSFAITYGAAGDHFGGAISFTKVGAEATAFLARTSGLDTTHTNAYTALINGLVADGLWSKFDALYIFATQNSTTALLNLISSTYNATANSGPTFTADRGFTGVNGGAPYIDTGFNPASASSPKYVQDSAHISMWNLTNTSFANAACGIADAAAHYCLIYPQYDITAGYAAVNQTSLGSGFAPAGDCRGHVVANRSSSTATNIYRNASSVRSESIGSATVPNGNIWCLYFHNLAGGSTGNGHQHAMLSFGSSLNSTDVTNFYNRLRTYMTAVGVP